MPLGLNPVARDGPSPVMRGQPVDMRAGRGAGHSLGSARGMPPAMPVEDAWQPLPVAAPPTSVRTWQGLVRLGLLHMAAGSQPADPAAAAETLACDLGRLRAAQNAFQQLVVLAACSLLLHRTAAACGRALSPGDLPAAEHALSLTQARMELFYACSLGAMPDAPLRLPPTRMCSSCACAAKKTKHQRLRLIVICFVRRRACRRKAAPGCRTNGPAAAAPGRGGGGRAAGRRRRVRRGVRAGGPRQDAVPLRPRFQGAHPAMKTLALELSFSLYLLRTYLHYFQSSCCPANW